jgi:hypothetical protein
MKFPTHFVVLITIISLGTFAIADLSTGLMAHWEMEETSGIVAYDSTANGYDLVEVSSYDIDTASTTGVIGNGFLFDGTTQARLANADLWATTIPAATTIAGWLKPMEGNPSSSGWFNKQPGAPYDQLQLYCGAGANFKAQWRNNSADSGGTSLTTLDSGVAVTNGVWTHVAFTWDSSGAEIFINGVSKKTSTEPMMTATGGTTYLGTGNLWLNPFKGVMDDVRVYDRVLSSTEIGQLAIPEPCTLVLLSLGGLLIRKRK